MTRPLRLVVALLALAATTACVRLPETGPVVPAGDQGQAETRADITFRPKPPQEGDSASAIVDGFLTAMTAVPIDLTTARKFLTEDADAAWDPQERIITFATRGGLSGQQEVRVPVGGVSWVDERGSWRGRYQTGEDVLDFPMTDESGEWRIAQVKPNALIVDQNWFEENYLQASVYFFDPTATIVVPEPVYVPAGEQLSAALMSALLAGPDTVRQPDVVRTFVPSGLEPGLSVPVDDGVADISLKGDAGAITEQTAQLMVYQLAWTLRQDPRIESFTVTIGDQPITVGGQARFSRDLGSEFDPTDIQASSALFAVRDGLLESGTAEDLGPVTGPLGGTAYGIERFGISLRGAGAAFVADGGSAVLVAPVSSQETGQGSVQQVVSGATDLLSPAWDFDDRLWLVDRTLAGARVSYLDAQGGPTALPVRGLTGRPVKDFLVSRDGTRLVALLRGQRSDRLVVSRIRHDAQGQVLGATRARAIPWNDTDVRRVRDLAWRSPTTVAVLRLLTNDVSQVLSVPLDGSPIGAEAQGFTQRSRVQALVSSPVGNETLFTLTRSRREEATATGGLELHDVTRTDDSNVPLRPGVTSVQYVG